MRMGRLKTAEGCVDYGEASVGERHAVRVAGCVYEVVRGGVADGRGRTPPGGRAGFTPGGAPRLPKRRPKGPGASLRDDRGGGVSLSTEREAGLAGIAETLAAGVAVHGGKPAV